MTCEDAENRTIFECGDKNTTIPYVESLVNQGTLVIWLCANFFCTVLAIYLVGRPVQTKGHVLDSSKLISQFGQEAKKEEKSYIYEVSDCPLTFINGYYELTGNIYNLEPENTEYTKYRSEHPASQYGVFKQYILEPCLRCFGWYEYKLQFHSIKLKKMEMNVHGDEGTFWVFQRSDGTILYHHRIIIDDEDVRHAIESQSTPKAQKRKRLGKKKSGLDCTPEEYAQTCARLIKNMTQPPPDDWEISEVFENELANLPFL
eukprot:g3659.t1